MFSEVSNPDKDGYCISDGYEEIYQHTIERVNHGTILDVACGGGKHAINLAKKGFQVYAIELTTEGLRIARAAAKQAGVNIRFIQGDVEHMPFRDGTFDYCFCGLIFHHFRNTNRFMDEVCRITRNGIFGVEPNACEPVCYLSFNIVNRLFTIKSMTKNQRAIFPGSFMKSLTRRGFGDVTIRYISIRQHTTGKLGKILSWYQRMADYLPDKIKFNKFIFSAKRILY